MAPGPSRQIMYNFLVTGANFDLNENQDTYSGKRDINEIDKMYNEICMLKRKK